MKVTRIIVTAALATLAALTFAGCAGTAGQPTTNTTTSSSTATTLQAPTSTSTKPSSSPSTTSAAPLPVTFSISCNLGKVEYETYKEAWTHLYSAGLCDATRSGGSEYTKQQKKAVAVSGAIIAPITNDNYDNGVPYDYALGAVYAQCASTSVTPTSDYLFTDESGAAAARAELVLCPDHPDAVAIKAGINAFDKQQATLTSAQAAGTAHSKAVTNGTYAYAGAHLVGSEIKPGTWQTVDKKVTDCYWEISDSQGNIIDNNFVSVAPQFTITIPSSAAGFTNSGCAFERIG